MSDDPTQRDLAEQVLAAYSDSTIDTWGREMDKLVDLNSSDHLKQWREQIVVAALGRYVKAIKAADARRRSAMCAVTHDGQPFTSMTPTISVKSGEARQLMLWWECSPGQFMDAVWREAATVAGRSESNDRRMKFVELLQEHPDAMALPTVKEAAALLGVDITELALEELPG